MKANKVQAGTKVLTQSSLDWTITFVPPCMYVFCLNILMLNMCVLYWLYSLAEPFLFRSRPTPIGNIPVEANKLLEAEQPQKQSLHIRWDGRKDFVSCLRIQS